MLDENTIISNLGLLAQPSLFWEREARANEYETRATIVIIIQLIIFFISSSLCLHLETKMMD